MLAPELLIPWAALKLHFKVSNQRQLRLLRQRATKVASKWRTTGALCKQIPY